MATALQWTGDDEEPVPASFPSSQHRIRGRRTPARPGELPPEIEAAIWRGTELGSPVSSVLSSGFVALDAELPGSGWPCHSLTEILQPQPTVAEWRLLAPVMRRVVAGGGNIVVVGPPKSPHLPGLKYAGLDERHLVWIQAESPAERLWVTEQLVKTNAAGLLVSWLPQARQEQIRRLQVCAQVRISAIVDARFSLIVDGETASRRTRRGGAQALRLNVAQSSTISLKRPSVEPLIGLAFGLV